MIYTHPNLDDTHIETFTWPDEVIRDLLDCACALGHFVARRRAQKKNIPLGYLKNVIERVGIPEEGLAHNHAQWRPAHHWAHNSDDRRAEMLREHYNDPGGVLRGRGKRGQFPVKKINGCFHFFDGPQFAAFIEEFRARLHNQHKAA